MEKKNCPFLAMKARHYTHFDSKFYYMPIDFPCILHDPRGCVYLDRDKFDELVALDEIRISRRKNDSEAINIRKGIFSLKGYTPCEEAGSCPKARIRKQPRTGSK